MRSACLKIQKRAWRNEDARPFEESVFFSVWVNDESLTTQKLNYNIHALKMREQKAYTIKSREFAEAFRSRFKPFEALWPNVSVSFGPLTLMEGWIPIDTKHFEKEIADMAYRFIDIHPIIDDLLRERKNPRFLRKTLT